MDKDNKTKILLIEDDEDDYVLVRDFLNKLPRSPYVLDWESAYDAGLDKICLNRHHIYLIDYRLGEKTGLELLREAIDRGCPAPIILLTGQGDHEVDLEAMKSGAWDYISKNELTESLLDRSIRYAIEKGRIMNDLRESESRSRLLAGQLLKAQEAERRSIARDIHDSFSSSLAAIKFKVESVLFKIDENPSPITDSLKEIIPFIQEAIDEARRIQMNLRPSILDDLGILATIGWFCRQFGETHPAVSLKQELTVEEGAIAPPLKIAIFRVLQEALNNIVKHSQATEVLVALKKREQAIHLSIQDNGVGFNVAEKGLPGHKPRGLGLESMRERVELSGGTFTVESTVTGTVIKAQWLLE